MTWNPERDRQTCADAAVLDSARAWLSGHNPPSYMDHDSVLEGTQARLDYYLCRDGSAEAIIGQLVSIVERLARPELDRLERELSAAYTGKHEAGA